MSAQDAVDLHAVRSLLSDRCFACHGPDAAKRRAGLRLDTRDGIQDALTRADTGVSELVARIDSTDPERVMPPPDAGTTLDATERALLRAWVEGGAPFVDHWAFVAPTRPEVPDGAPHPIDAFVHAQLLGTGLTPAAEAPTAVLLRRLHLDLVGVPPTPDDVRAFEHAHAADPDGAVADAVDRLLAQPGFGETWARPWLDLARYADSNGYQADQLRPSWAYRDWVIRAIDDNMPFDQFTVEQLAGDLLPDATLDQRIATGFHRAAPCNVEAGVLPEENRTLQVFDRVNTTATVWLGLTMECAQCHDHKYDPIPTRDYYRLFAYFNHTPLEVELPSGTTDVSHDFVGPYLDLPLSPAQEEARRSLERDLRDAETARDAHRSAALPDWIERNRLAAENTPTWRTLAPADLKTTGQEEVRFLDDGSALLVGPVPDVATYTLRLAPAEGTITMLRLEALSHPEISGEGPGRGDTARPNFVLNELEVTRRGEPVTLGAAWADFSQKGWPAEGAIDGDPASGWAIAPRFGKPHDLTVSLDPPIEGGELTVTLRQQWGRGRVLGCVRISVSDGDPADTHALSDAVLDALRSDPTDWSHDQRAAVEAAFTKSDPRARSLEDAAEQLASDLAALQPDRTLVMEELEERRVTRVLRRGHYLDPGDEVEPGTPEALPPSTGSDRLALARWIVDPANPLTARVVVNRWWAQLFGRGLVETLEDFGHQAAPPSHPELLDWLAVELVASGWDRKHVLRQILTSRTYRQDSILGANDRDLDPANVRLARGPRVRLAAETIRDQALAAAGLLDSTRFGPPVMPYQPDGVWRAVGRNAPRWEEAQDASRYRRGVYVVWRRAAPYPSFVTFDAPDRASCTVGRPRTNTPLQALTLLNDPVFLEAALALADRALAEAPEQPITRAFRRVLARHPESAELDRLRELWRARRADYERAPERARALIEGVRARYEPASDDPAALAALFHVTHVLLNLDETVVKG